MISYIIRRLILMPITLFGITVMVFAIARFAPGRPGQMQQADQAMDAEKQKAIQEWYDKRYGLDLPLYRQYARWWKGLFTRDIQAVAWTGEDSIQPLFTLRRAKPEYFVKGQNGSWFQVASMILEEDHYSLDDITFRSAVNKEELNKHHPVSKEGYSEPTHLFASSVLNPVGSLDKDVEAGRLERAVDLDRVRINVKAPAWTDKGEELYVNPDNVEIPLFEREGIWYALKLSNTIKNAEIKPVNDAAVRTRLGEKFDSLAQEEDDYSIPRHAFLFGIPERIETPPASADTLERLTITTDAVSPSGMWTNFPNSTTRAMLWQMKEPLPIILIKNGDMWQQLIGVTRTQVPEAEVYLQDDKTFLSLLTSGYKEQLDPPEEDERIPRHVVLKGKRIAYLGEVSDRDLRQYHHDITIFEVTLGESIQSRSTVMEELSRRLPVTLMINLIAFPLIYMLAIPTGMLMAIKRGKFFDTGANILMLGCWSIPIVLSATLLIGYTAEGGAWLQWFPSTGLSSPYSEVAPFTDWIKDRMWHLILPIFCIMYGGLAYLAKQMRAAMLDNFTMDYVRTARAKGVPSKDIVFRHVLRNSLLPLITIFATILPALIAGSIIIEKIFGIEGMGLLAFRAVQNRDYDVVQSLALIAGVLNLSGLLIADMCYAFADPRITYK